MPNAENKSNKMKVTVRNGMGRNRKIPKTVILEAVQSVGYELGRD